MKTTNEQGLCEKWLVLKDLGKRMISFDVSEVATGFAGLVTVEISTELLEDVLMSHTYIK